MPCVPAALQPSKIKGMKLPQDKATQAKPGRGHDCHPNPVPAFSTCKVTRKHQPGDGSWAHTCHREQALAKARTPWRKSSSPRKDLYNIASFSQTLYSKSQQHSSSFDTTAKKALLVPGWESNLAGVQPGTRADFTEKVVNHYGISITVSGNIPQSIHIPFSPFLLCFQAPMVLPEEPGLEAPTAAHA